MYRFASIYQNLLLLAQVQRNMQARNQMQPAPQRFTVHKPIAPPRVTPQPPTQQTQLQMKLLNTSQQNLSQPTRTQPTVNNFASNRIITTNSSAIRDNNIPRSNVTNGEPTQNVSIRTAPVQNAPTQNASDQNAATQSASIPNTFIQNASVQNVSTRNSASSPMPSLVPVNWDQPKQTSVGPFAHTNPFSTVNRPTSMVLNGATGVNATDEMVKDMNKMSLSAVAESAPTRKTVFQRLGIEIAKAKQSVSSRLFVTQPAEEAPPKPLKEDTVDFVQNIQPAQNNHAEEHNDDKQVRLDEFFILHSSSSSLPLTFLIIFRHWT